MSKNDGRPRDDSVIVPVLIPANPNMVAQGSDTGATFILGLMPRSGTNFLSDLLCLHPRCAAPVPVLEDYLIYRADLLIRYAESVTRLWRPDWGVDERLRRSLPHALGDALLDVLGGRAGAGKRLVTKTPSVRNLAHFFTVFPDARLLLLVRDGRSTVESGVRSFKYSYEWGMRRWADAADTVTRFERGLETNQHRYLRVRFEDLWRDREVELRRIFEFMHLDPAAYDFQAAAKLPVRGSSVLRGGEEAVHWKPVKGTPDFDPTERWRHWDGGLHARFDWIAGQQLATLGYPRKRPPTPRPVYYARNAILDLWWLAGGAVRWFQQRSNWPRLARSRVSKPDRQDSS